MKILITGASSYVGARLYFDIRKTYDTVGTYSLHQLSPNLVRLDITKPEEIQKVVHDTRPDIIVHVAQNPNPRWCEVHPNEANMLNIDATRQLVDQANRQNAKLIYISSFAAISPNDVYGHTKRDSENLVRQTHTGYLIIRPSFILGFSPNTVNDRPFNRLLKNLDTGTPAVYDTSWKFQPTYLGHISEVILACIQKNIWNETIHVTVPEMKTRFETARDILTPFGVTVTPVDNHDTTNVFQYPLTELTKLKLPRYTYKQMIEKIISEIRHRDRFVL